MASIGTAENNKIRSQLENQISRLLAQVEDLDSLRVSDELPSMVVVMVGGPYWHRDACADGHSRSAFNYHARLN